MTTPTPPPLSGGENLYMRREATLAAIDHALAAFNEVGLAKEVAGMHLMPTGERTTVSGLPSGWTSISWSFRNVYGEDPDAFRERVERAIEALATFDAVVDASISADSWSAHMTISTPVHEACVVMAVRVPIDKRLAKPTPERTVLRYDERIGSMIEGSDLGDLVCQQVETGVLRG